VRVPTEDRPEHGRARIGFDIWLLRVKEYLTFDSAVFKTLLGSLIYAAGFLLQLAGDTRRRFQLLSALHRADWLSYANERVERWISRNDGRPDPKLAALYGRHALEAAPTSRTASFFEEPERKIGTTLLVLKSPAYLEKGVLLIQYSYTFPLFSTLFDIEAVMSRYHLVLEPSWSGLCDLDVLSYSQFPSPVFVQAFEPRDARLIERMHSNLIVVPTGANWWVDDHLFRPLSPPRKDADVIMVAAWGRYKRHHRFFAALGRLRRAGHKLRVILLGYPLDLTMNDIVRQARYFGVQDQVEIYESISYESVNGYLNRARVNVLWSRREGTPRTLLEGMFANVPCFVRQGFNYGYKYPYINAVTGVAASESALPNDLLSMVENHAKFSPRTWAEENMSCEIATDILGAIIRDVAVRNGERWTQGLAVKINRLHDMTYKNPAARERFQDDYSFLRSTIRKRVPS
jgi:glycosyltransferase involved in cell wall biosynthesis